MYLMYLSVQAGRAVTYDPVGGVGWVGGVGSLHSALKV